MSRALAGSEYCQDCKYDLAGLESRQCPECGGISRATQDDLDSLRIVKQYGAVVAVVAPAPLALFMLLADQHKVLESIALLYPATFAGMTVVALIADWMASPRTVTAFEHATRTLAIAYWGIPMAMVGGYVILTIALG